MEISQKICCGRDFSKSKLVKSENMFLEDIYLENLLVEKIFS